MPPASTAKTYAELDCVQGPTVDAMVWYSLDAAGQATVDGTVAGMLLSQATLDGVFTAKGMTTAQAGFDAEVAGGMNMELAFYKWLGYESFRNGTAVYVLSHTAGRECACRQDLCHPYFLREVAGECRSMGGSRRG